MDASVHLGPESQGERAFAVDLGHARKQVGRVGLRVHVEHRLLPHLILGAYSNVGHKERDLYRGQALSKTQERSHRCRRGVIDGQHHKVESVRGHRSTEVTAAEQRHRLEFDEH